jgi:hypothetical protein
LWALSVSQTCQQRVKTGKSCYFLQVKVVLHNAQDQNGKSPSCDTRTLHIDEDNQSGSHASFSGRFFRQYSVREHMCCSFLFSQRWAGSRLALAVTPEIWGRFVQVSSLLPARPLCCTRSPCLPRWEECYEIDVSLVTAKGDNDTVSLTRLTYSIRLFKWGKEAENCLKKQFTWLLGCRC